MAELPCKTCRNALKKLREGELGHVGDRVSSISHYSKYKELVNSGRSCGFCKKLLAEVNGQASEADSESSRGFKFNFLPNATQGISYSWQDSSEKERRIILLFVVQESYPNHSLTWTSTRPLSLNDWVPIIKGWIHACDARQNDKHHVCMQGRESRRLPSRLIHIQKMETGQHSARLVETSTLDDSIVYMTLSHRWGPPSRRPLETRMSNLEDHLTEIPFDKIPKTYLDAIMLTLEIGKQYIWIDSLCIIQGSKEDWEREAARMKDVYSGSYLNLAALDSEDASGGRSLDTTEPAWRFRYSRKPDNFISIRSCPLA
jgi:heterokaryon incompatibility protein (HET)